MGFSCGRGRESFSAYLVVMVKYRIFLHALGALLAVGVAAASVAGSALRITGDMGDFNGNSRDIPLATSGTSVSYSFATGQPVATVDLSEFLFCNRAEVGSEPTIALVARHDAWTYGSPTTLDGGTSVIAPVPMVSNMAYVGQVLWLTTDLPQAGGGTQCFLADAHGQGITDLNHIFAGSFDAGSTSASNTSAVTISVGPLPQDTDHAFEYVVQIDIDGTSGNGSGTSSTQSLPSTNYYLREGFDTSVFSSCTSTPGQAIDHSITYSRSCTVKSGVNLQALNGTVPVVAAALFSGPYAGETDFSDNLAFGYPRESTYPQ